MPKMSAEYQRQYRLRRKAAGNPVKSGSSKVWDEEKKKQWLESYYSSPDVLARKAEQMRRYAQIHKSRHAARRILRTAIESGRVKPQPCAVCGVEQVEGHHVAYDMPVDVIWLCKPHHRQLHAEAKVKGGAT